MEFKVFLRKRREALGLTQQKVADELSAKGYEASPAKVGHWETGRNKPPLNDPTFRRIMASVLQMDINQMMDDLGYIINSEDRSAEAQLAAAIVDDLPPDAQNLALDYLQLLQKRFVPNN